MPGHYAKKKAEKKYMGKYIPQSSGPLAAMAKKAAKKKAKPMTAAQKAAKARAANR